MTPETQTRTGYTKPQSHTQRQARAGVATIREIILQAGITKDWWVNLLFETGCRFVEAGTTNEDHIRQKLEEDEGFWPWWIDAFVNDDANILKHYQGPLNPAIYEAMKEDLVSLGNPTTAQP